MLPFLYYVIKQRRWTAFLALSGGWFILGFHLLAALGLTLL